MTSKKAVIVSLTDSLAELTELAHTLEYHIVKEFIQHRTYPDANCFVGSGKVQEIKDFINESSEPIDIVIINGELKPSQWFLLEKELHVDVYDRIRLILTIFEQRAERKEARLQVRLAQLQYQRPFVRELIHRARAGEHPGYMAGGEYQVDDYYEMIKRQMKNIREELDKIRLTREVHRQTRYKSGFYLISLVGYTNAGKSSLLNLLTDEHVTVEGRLFSTLSTTTRKIKQSTNTQEIPILLTDTVGFIEDLPTWIIDAFHSTLEEIEVADVILLLVDASDPKEIIEKKLTVSLSELLELGANAPIILVFNKIDLLTQHQCTDLTHYLSTKHILNNKQSVFISVKDKQGIEHLRKTIHNSLPQVVTLSLTLPHTKAALAFISNLYKKTQVTDISYDKNITIQIYCNPKIKDKIIAQCQTLQGTID